MIEIKVCNEVQQKKITVSLMKLRAWSEHYCVLSWNVIAGLTMWDEKSYMIAIKVCNEVQQKKSQ